MTEELQKVLRELHGITNNFNLTGAGVAGNLVDGYVVQAAIKGHGSPCVSIDTATLVASGVGYSVGEIMRPFFGTACPPADSFPYGLRVDSVDGLGAVTSFSIVPGIGYLIPPDNPVGYGGTVGTGFIANCTYA